MKIIIETNGDARDTSISFNNQTLLPPLAMIKDFRLSIQADGKLKLRLLAFNPQTKKYEIPLSMYGNDFKKYEELNNLTGGEQSNGTKSKSNVSK